MADYYNVVIASGTERNLQKKLLKWNETLLKYGMKMNIAKTKVLKVLKGKKEISINVAEGKNRINEQISVFRK